MHEFDAIGSRCCGENTRAAVLRELDAKHADVSARAVHDDALALLELERVIHALQSSEPECRKRGRVDLVETVRHACNLRCGHSDVLREEAALWIPIAVRLDVIADG